MTRLGGIGLMLLAAVGLGGAAGATTGGRSPGSFDTGFGASGRVSVALAKNDFIGPVAGPLLQRQGRLVIVASGSGRRTPPYNSTGTDLLLVRLRASGAIDHSFGNRGATRTRLKLARGGEVQVADATLAPDGKIVVIGRVRTKKQRLYWLFARYLPDGRLDRTFGSNGIRFFSGFGKWEYWDGAKDVVVQRNGQIVAAGSLGAAGWLVLRLRRDGSLDRSFGSKGVVRTEIGNAGPRDAAMAVALLPRGKIAVGGAADGMPIDSHFAVARYLRDGRIDRSFGSSGSVILDRPYGRGDQITQLLPLPDGRLLGVGYDFTGDPERANVRLARFLPGGSLDRTFGQQGIAVAPFDKVVAQPRSVVRQRDGRVLVAGMGRWNFDDTTSLLARYLPDGSIDSGFGAGGWRLYSFCEAFDGYSAVLQRVGRRTRIVQAGAAHCGGLNRLVVIGIRPAGEPPPKGQYRAETKSGSLFVPGTRRLRLRCTYCTTPIKLPWVVHVYGLGFRRGYVSPNGNLQFDTESASEDFDYCLPSPLIGTAIAPYWAQLYMDKGSGIWTRVLGKKPHRRFVLEWRHIAMWLRGAMTFEILLREDSTTVATIYGPGTWSFNNRGFAAGVQQEGGRGFCSRFEPVQGLEIDYVWQRG